VFFLEKFEKTNKNNFSLGMTTNKLKRIGSWISNKNGLRSATIECGDYFLNVEWGFNVFPRDPNAPNWIWSGGKIERNKGQIKTYHELHNNQTVITIIHEEIKKKRSFDVRDFE